MVTTENLTGFEHFPCCGRLERVKVVESRPFAKLVLNLFLELLVVDVPVRTDTLADDLGFEVVYSRRRPGVVTDFIPAPGAH